MLESDLCLARMDKMFDSRLMFINIGLCAVLCTLAWVSSLYLTEGVPTYAIDDAYIHLAHARNLAETGVWGIRPNEYAFCSSSPLWTCVLAVLFKILGFHECIPGVLCFLSCLGCAFVIAFIFQKSKCGAIASLLLGLSALIAIPVSTSVVLGMEHATHVLLVLMLVHLWLTDELSVWKWGLIAFLAVGVRYESLFVIVPLCMVAFCLRRCRQAFSLAVGAALPVFIYGVYAVVQGGHFLPNSLVVKAVLPHAKNFLGTLTDAFLCVNVKNPLVYFSGLMMFFVSLCPSRQLRLRALAMAFGVAIFGHLVFARTGWPYNVNRYEMYLLAGTFVIVGLSMVDALIGDRLHSSGKGRLLRLIEFSICLIYLVASVAKGGLNGVQVLNASRETYEVPMTAARIFATLPEESQGAIYLNDLGLIAERTRVPVIDVCGLGEQDSFEMLMRTSRSLKDQAAVLKKRQARYAAVFNCFHWTIQVLSHEFLLKPVATLCSPARGVWVGCPISLYAFRAEDEKLLAQHVKHLPFRLPKNVTIIIRSDLKDDCME